MTFLVNAEKRKLGETSPRKLRRKGLVPALYQGKNQKHEYIQIPEKELAKLLKSHEQIVEITIDGNTKVKAVMQEIQFEPISKKVLHLNFLHIEKGSKVYVTVPLQFAGTAKGVKDGGVLVHNLREIEVECSPENVPEMIPVDVIELNIGDVLHLTDLLLPEGIKLSPYTDAEREVVSVKHARSEEAETTTTEIASTEEAATPESAEKVSA